MAKITRIAIIVCIIIIDFVAAQDNKQKKNDWEKNRQLFNTYFASPTTDNAEKVLSVLPDRIDVTDFENLNGTMYIFYQEHITDLSKMVKEGDRLALRIAFKAGQLMDGIYAESLDSLIGFSIKVAPTAFLEEAVPYLKKQSEWFASLYPHNQIGVDWLLGGILVGNIDFDQNRPDVIEKEIVLRIEALASVKRQDLLELRDICLDILKERIKQESRIQYDKKSTPLPGQSGSPRPRKRLYLPEPEIIKSGVSEGNRTPNLRIHSPML